MEKIKIGGEERDNPILSTTNDDGLPKLYTAKIKGFNKKSRGTDDQGNPNEYLVWRFLVKNDEAKDENEQYLTMFGTTGLEARRSYKDNKPVKLLSLVIAANKGEEPEKGVELDVEKDILNKLIRVTLENKDGQDGQYQVVQDFYPLKGDVSFDDDDDDQLPEVDLDAVDEVDADDIPF